MRSERRSLRRLIASGLVVAGAANALTAQDVLHPRVIAINYNPIMENRGGQRVHDAFGWREPNGLTSEYISDFVEASHGLLNQRLNWSIDADVYPIKLDGFRYTDESYWSAWQNQSFHQPDGVDYRAISRDYDLARRVDRGLIDEAIVHGAPYFGYWESTMAGRGGYWCNSGPQQRIACSKIFIMMGFNYERGVAEMLHSAGHRSESIMSFTYGGWDIREDRHDWERFTHNLTQSGDSACGSVHYPPNAESDYDYANERFVDSTADDWMFNFPNLTGQMSSVNRETWGGVDYHRNFLKWWYAHMPHVAGRNNHDGLSRLNSWWPYLFDFNRYDESGGDHAPGGSPPGGLPYPGVVVQGTMNQTDDWEPRVNDRGQVVWFGFDGHDFEIYATDRQRQVRRLTDNTMIDESPQINANGRVVWQAFDGQDYEIFTANFDGSEFTQITDNTVDDWHPQINDVDRIVWEGWDGEDYEIFSANADGSGPAQVTDNRAASGYPREDVWPQINNRGRVVWFGFDGADWEIYSANADGTDLVQLTDNNYDDEYPQINNRDDVVWHAWISDQVTDVFSAPARGGAVKQLSNSNGEDWYPQLNDDGKVVWMARDGDDWDIYLCNVSGVGLRAITFNSTHDQYPVIDDDGRVTWQGFDGNDWEIYRWGYERTYQVTDNETDDRAPSASGSRIIVWHGERGAGAGPTTSEIFGARDPR